MTAGVQKLFRHGGNPLRSAQIVGGNPAAAQMVVNLRRLFPIGGNIVVLFRQIRGFSHILKKVFVQIKIPQGLLRIRRNGHQPLKKAVIQVGSVENLAVSQSKASGAQSQQHRRQHRHGLSPAGFLSGKALPENQSQDGYNPGNAKLAGREKQQSRQPQGQPEGFAPDSLPEKGRPPEGKGCKSRHRHKQPPPAVEGGKIEHIVSADSRKRPQARCQHSPASKQGAQSFAQEEQSQRVQHRQNSRQEGQGHFPAESQHLCQGGGIRQAGTGSPLQQAAPGNASSGKKSLGASLGQPQLGQNPAIEPRVAHSRLGRQEQNHQAAQQGDGPQGKGSQILLLKGLFLFHISPAPGSRHRQSGGWRCRRRRGWRQCSCAGIPPHFPAAP